MFVVPYRRALPIVSRASASDERNMADEIKPTEDHDMIAAQPDEKEGEQSSHDIGDLKKSVADDVEGKDNADQEEEEEYVLKDEAHEEEDNQKDGM